MDVKTLSLGDYQTNCYILTKGSACLVIDPGYESRRLTAALAGLEVQAVVLTHGHFDHVGAVRALAMEYDCPVYMGRGELSLPPMMSAGPLYYTNLLDEGEVTIGDFSLRVLATPGHSPGSVCLLIEDCLFSGDTLFAGSCGRTDFPGSDPRAMAESLRRLAGLEKDYTVYPGHGEASTLEEEKKYNPYLR
ncbi:MAG: MBL fold metallo-hydrolase [Eubacteriales bacterium]|nr:MBL fold metallo-hydrolase [Eubacteriales bacterium]